MRCQLTDDVDEFLAAARDFLESRPVQHNLVLSLAHYEQTRRRASRWAWVTDPDDRVVGALIQSPADYSATMTPMPVEAVTALVALLARETPDLPGFNGEAATTAAFAGAWASLRRIPVQPAEGQRLYQLGRLVQPDDGVPGSLRRAAPPDAPRLTAWDEAFAADTGLTRPAGDRTAVISQLISEGLFWVWESAYTPVAMAFTTPPSAGASRIGAVYTPPEERGRGYGGACVGAISAELLRAGVRHCLLYTQLSNPVSNRIYQRLGYEPVGEILVYRCEH